MGRGQKSKEPLSANSRLSRIGVFNPKIVSWDTSCDQPIATFKPIKYIDFRQGIIPQQERLIRNFPIIFRDSGAPWDLGNLYLQRYFYEAAKRGDEPPIDTLRSKAKHLTAYLRWIETMQAKGIVTSELDFPEDPDDRVTYRYKRYLQSLLRQVPQVISLSVAKERMSQVIQFYRMALKWGLVERESIKNAPFKEIEVGIQYINSRGVRAIINALSTDISFRIRRSSDEDPFVINDGEKLIPLTLAEQTVALEALRSYGNRVFELMVHVAIRTGARLQTVGTLRISEIRWLLKQRPNKYGEVTLKVGAGYLTDIKGEKKYHRKGLLFFPLDLVTQLLDYSDSTAAQARREKSFYGDSDENYLFLNEDGRPFYTSHQEMLDRVNSAYSKRVSLRDRVDFPIAEGQAVNGLMKRLRNVINAQYPDFRHFRFHDFRATYGMNFIRNWIDAGNKPNVGVGMLKVRMIHKSESTTYQYLNYAAEVEEVTKLEDAHFATLNRRSPS